MNLFTPVTQLKVFRRLSSGDRVLVGLLALQNGTIFFRYDVRYLKDYHNLSPLKLPFNNQIIPAPPSIHNGLHGLFADSLPDSWGMLLMDTYFQQQGVPPEKLTALDRLAYIGNRGMGALEYVPASDCSPSASEALIDISKLGEHAQNFYEDRCDSISQLLAYAGSAGGCRPKAQIYFRNGDSNYASIVPKKEYEPWLLKFSSDIHPLGHEESLCEAAYLTIAKQAGIEVPEWQLINAPESSQAISWLATRRFDCPSEFGRYHMLSLSNLLDVDFNKPSLDYEEIIRVSQIMCNDPDIGRTQFCRAIFNLFALNQNDHAKNWTFLQNDEGTWSLAPFYDVLLCLGTNGEHTTAYASFTKHPTTEAMQYLARKANYTSWKEAQQDIAKIMDAIQHWPAVANEFNIKRMTRNLVNRHLNEIYQKNRALLPSIK